MSWVANQTNFNDVGSGWAWSDQSNNNKATLDSSGDLSIFHLDQMAAKNFAGTCSMSSSTSCTWTLAGSYTGAPICIAVAQGITPIAAACSVSGTTVTVTAASANSLTWGAMVIGNPN